MTFDQALNNDMNKINYLGGLTAIYPYIPYSIDLIRHRLENNPESTAENESFADTAPIAWERVVECMDEYFEEYPSPAYKESFRGLCASKGITEISKAEGIRILKTAAEKIARLPEKEYDAFKSQVDADKNPKTHRYTVKMTIQGNVNINIDAKNEDDAYALAEEVIGLIDTGDILDIRYGSKSICEHM